MLFFLFALEIVLRFKKSLGMFILDKRILLFGFYLIKLKTISSKSYSSILEIRSCLFISKWNKYKCFAFCSKSTSSKWFLFNFSIKWNNNNFILLQINWWSLFQVYLPSGENQNLVVEIRDKFNLSSISVGTDSQLNTNLLSIW